MKPLKPSEKLNKRQVHYREAESSKRCRNCIMFHTNGTCDLVKGNIQPEDVCDRWETRVRKQENLDLLARDLREMRAELVDVLDRIDMFREISPKIVKEQESRRWVIQREAYQIYVKLDDAEYIGNVPHPSDFGWTVDQIGNETLREWLCKSAETPRVSTEHHPLGREGLWHTPSKKVPEKQQLPAYIQNTARALMRDHGTEESEAIATAIQAVRAWAAGKAFGGKVKVTDEVKRAAQAALEEWEKLKASHHVGKAEEMSSVQEESEDS